MSSYHLDAYEYGQIVAHRSRGLSVADIAARVGRSPESVRRAFVRWEALGEKALDRKPGSGRPSLTTKSQDRQVRAAVLKLRGSRKGTPLVTIPRSPVTRLSGDSLGDHPQVPSYQICLGLPW